MYRTPLAWTESANHFSVWWILTFPTSRLPPWWAICRWAILISRYINIAHPGYNTFFMYAFIMHSELPKINILFCFSFLGLVGHFQKGDEFCQLSVVIVIIFLVISAYISVQNTMWYHMILLSNPPIMWLWSEMVDSYFIRAIVCRPRKFPKREIEPRENRTRCSSYIC